MIIIKDEVLSVLKQLNIRVYHIEAPLNNLEYPFLIYREDLNIPGLFADDEEYATRIDIVVDLYCKGSTSTLTKEINKKMFNLGFVRTLSRDIPDPTEGVQHKTLRFEINKLN